MNINIIAVAKKLLCYTQKHTHTRYIGRLYTSHSLQILSRVYFWHFIYHHSVQNEETQHTYLPLVAIFVTSKHRREEVRVWMNIRVSCVSPFGFMSATTGGLVFVCGECVHIVWIDINTAAAAAAAIVAVDKNNYRYINSAFSFCSHSPSLFIRPYVSVWFYALCEYKHLKKIYICIQKYMKKKETKL